MKRSDSAALSPPIRGGSRIGSYEVLAPLGSGGMGEVWRARDPKLAREVALKVLPAELSEDEGRRRRFEREARASSALNHPNIVTVYEIGASDGIPYIAMELVSGKTLRERCRSGALPARKVLEIAVQIARGLARAHSEGIVHRDLKPENVMISDDGVVKILDFGLAKLVRSPIEPGASGDGDTASLATEPGLLLGTYGYMSPEQVGGQSTDYRSDQFALGSILYEMATGRRAFQKEKAIDTLSAILHAEPEPLSASTPPIPAPLRWIIERCLAKDPKERYASTDDLARDLAGLREHLSEASSAGALMALPAPRRVPFWALCAAAALALIGIGVLAGRTSGRTTPPRFRQVTFRHEGIQSARFAPDGQTLVFAAAREGEPTRLYATRLDSPEVRFLGLSRCEILSMSRNGEMAINLGSPLGVITRPPHNDTTLRDPLLQYGTLARVPLAGGAPRELLENVLNASWSPDGENLAVTRRSGSANVLEYPIGRALFTSETWLNHPQVSPDGARVAFTQIRTLMFVDRSGSRHTLSEDAWELAWAPGGEIWYSRPVMGGSNTEIRAVTTEGRDRLLWTIPGNWVLHDISAEGRVLFGSVAESCDVLGRFPGETRERNLSWLDRTEVTVLSADGSTVLLRETGAGAGSFGSEAVVYSRRTDGSPAQRLGAGSALALSADGRWALFADSEPFQESLVLMPTGAGSPRKLSTSGIQVGGRGGFFPDGRRVFFMGYPPQRRPRAYVLDLEGGAPRPITPEGTRRGLLSGDGRFLAAIASDGLWHVYPTEAGVERVMQGLRPGDEPTQWTQDGKALYVRGADTAEPGDSVIPARVYRVDPWTGRRELFTEIAPSTSTGGGIGRVLFAMDGRVCVYTRHRYASELFVVDGLK